LGVKFLRIQRFIEARIPIQAEEVNRAEAPRVDPYLNFLFRVWKLMEFNAKRNDVAIEDLVLTCERQEQVG
jgi:hypothetical protein